MGDDLLYGDGMPYEWGSDWPEVFDVLSMAKQNRTLSKLMSPLSVIEELNKLYIVARARPGKPGGKPLPAPPHEKEQENEARKKAQKETLRAILPKGKKEGGDLFLRRLDAHKINPNALLVEQMGAESDIETVKRFIATKENENEGVLVFPKTEHENEAEFLSRLEVAKKIKALVFGKGENETGDDFKLRMTTVPKSKAPIMVRSYGEPEKSFKTRIELQKSFDGTVPPFLAKKESEKEYAVRLKLQKDSITEINEPGDAKVKSLAAEQAEPPAAAPPTRRSPPAGSPPGRGS